MTINEALREYLLFNLVINMTDDILLQNGQTKILLIKKYGTKKRVGSVFTIRCDQSMV